MSADLGLALVLAGLAVILAGLAAHRGKATAWTPVGLAVQMIGEALQRLWWLAGLAVAILTASVIAATVQRRRVRDAAARRALAEAQALSRIEQMRRNARWS